MPRRKKRKIETNSESLRPKQARRTGSAILAHLTESQTFCEQFSMSPIQAKRYLRGTKTRADSNAPQTLLDHQIIKYLSGANLSLTTMIYLLRLAAAPQDLLDAAISGQISIQQVIQIQQLAPALRRNAIEDILAYKQRTRSIKQRERR